MDGAKKHKHLTIEYLRYMKMENLDARTSTYMQLQRL